MEYSLELLQSKTSDFINELEKSKKLHFMALMLAEKVLGHSKNFKLSFSSLIEKTDSCLNCVRIAFNYLDNINIVVVISRRYGTYLKIINVSATKNGYVLDDFKIDTNDVSEAVDKIIEYAENRNEKDTFCHKKHIKSVTDEEKNYMTEQE